MRKKTSRLTLTSIFTAFSVVFMYLASLFPTGQLGFMGCASLFGIAAVIETGYRGGSAHYAASSVLGALLVPARTLVVFYVLFFGCYPMVKAFAESRGSRIFEWFIKLLSFNAALIVMLEVVSFVVFDLGRLGDSKILMYLAANAVFVLFDLGVSQIIVFYSERISPNIRRNK